MTESETILYRGARYEVGLVRRCYAIWAVGEHQAPPLKWWPETPEGWSAAWAHFSGLEPAGAIVQVSPAAPAAPAPAGPAPAGPDPAAPAAQGGPAVTAEPEPQAGPAMHGGPADQLVVPGGPAAAPARWAGRAGGPPVVAAALLAAGVLCGFIGLFPGYVGGASLASDSPSLVPHLLYLAAWITGAGLIMLGGARMRAGALLALGTSIVTFGFFLADIGEAVVTSSGAGLVLAVIGWAACTAGAVQAVTSRRAGAPGRLRRADLAPLVLAMLAGLGVAAAFAPAWDSYTLRTARGLSQTVLLGNAFSNPGLVITGDVAVMIAVVAVVAAAALWRPVRLGAALLAGAIVPMVAQAISAMIGIGEPVSPAQFGVPPSQAEPLGLTIGSGLTAAFWIYCVFLVALVLACALLLVSNGHAVAQSSMPQSAMPSAPGSQPFGSPSGGPQPVMSPVAPKAQPEPADYGMTPASDALSAATRPAGTQDSAAPGDH